MNKGQLGWTSGGGGGSDPALTGRVAALENKLLKVYYYAEITATSGQISPPSGATILLDQWANGEDALVCAIVGGKPDFKATNTYVSSFDINGNFVLSGALPSNPAALIYVFQIKRIDFDANVNNDFVIQYVDTDIASEIHVAPNKTTPVDADEFGIWDSITGFLNKLTWANLKAILKTYFDGIYQGYATTATSAGTLTLDVNSKYQQFLTGSTTHTVVMPDVTTLVLGRMFIVENRSTNVGVGSITIQSSGTNQIIQLGRNEAVTLVCIAITGTGVASWDVQRENAGIEFVNITCSDIATALTAGTRKAFAYLDFNCKLLRVFGALGTVCTGSTFIFDINNGANSFLSTKLSLDASENTSLTAATAAVINATYEDYTAGTEISVDFDQVGATIAGAGASVLLKVLRT